MLRRALLILAIASGLAACAESPTVSAEKVEARQNGGWTIGSGRVETDTTTTISSPSQNGTSSTSSNGGWTIGSGFTPPEDQP